MWDAQDTAPLADRLSVLAAPTTIDILVADKANVILAVTYPGESLGFSSAS